MKNITLMIVGISPLLMHGDALVDPLAELTIERNKISQKKKKSLEDYRELARLEWTAALHFDREQGPVMPASNIVACLREGAVMGRQGRDISRALFSQADLYRLEYEGPRDVEGLWKAGWRDMRSVKQGRARIMRCRPIFRDWSLTAELAIDESILDEQQISHIADVAGRYVGIGDYRPSAPKGGNFGRFIATLA